MAKSIYEQEQEKYNEMLKRQQEQQANAFDATQQNYERFQARQQIGGNKYANAQMKMDAAKKAMEANAAETEAATASANKAAGAAGAGLQAIQMASSQGSGNTAADVGQGAASGALSGAMLGSAVPGIGTVAGGVVGGIIGGGIGLLQAGAAREQRQRQAQSEHFQRIAQIEQEKAARIQNALANMGAQMGSALTVPVIRI